MGDTCFQFAMPSFKAGFTAMVNQHPWTFAFAMFAVSVVSNSQTATSRMLLVGVITASLIGYGLASVPI